MSIFKATKSIRTPEVLHIRNNGAISYGAHQVWYPTEWQIRAGCGPTTASNQLLYLAETRLEKCGKLFKREDDTRIEMLRLMEKVWHYVTPGNRGVNKSSMLADGAVQYGADRGVELNARVLEVPEEAEDRPSAEMVLAFLKAAFADDLPVAFLNLSNGEVKNLDRWHWVTLISTDDALRAEMYDQSKRQIIDVALWLETTTGGGAFVVIEPK